jgi:chromosome segregation ATPase
LHRSKNSRKKSAPHKSILINRIFLLKTKLQSLTEENKTLEKQVAKLRTEQHAKERNIIKAICKTAESTSSLAGSTANVRYLKTKNKEITDKISKIQTTLEEQDEFISHYETKIEYQAVQQTLEEKVTMPLIDQRASQGDVDALKEQYLNIKDSIDAMEKQYKYRGFQLNEKLEQKQNEYEVAVKKASIVIHRYNELSNTCTSKQSMDVKSSKRKKAKKAIATEIMTLCNSLDTLDVD